MSWVDEKLTERFYEWEIRGRGWQIFDFPVRPEPPFREFEGHYLPAQRVADDGRIPTRLSSFVDAFQPTDEEPPECSDAASKENERLEEFERNELAELQVAFPRDFDPSPETFEQFLFNLHSCDDPVSFEVIAARGNILIQLAASLPDIVTIRHALQSYFPSALVTEQTEPLARLWSESSDRDAVVFEFGLKDEFMIPIESRRRDFLLAITSALSELTVNEIAVFQVLFMPVRHAWAVNVLRSVSDDEGRPFFTNRPELLAFAKNKITRPLYAAVMRVAALADNSDRSLRIVSRISTILESIGDPTGNSYIALDSADYPLRDHEHDLLKRQSRRPGMLLNSNELLLTVHLPSLAVQTPRLVRQINK